MAADYIKVDRTKQPGNQLVRLATLITEARQISDAIVNIGGHTINASDHTLLESVFGLQAGDGDDVAGLVTGINNILNKNTTVAGADRLTAINEFTGRLGLQ